MAQHTAAVEDGRSSTTAVQRPAAAPVWLAPERFEAADFSPDVCVADLRRYVPLPTVKAELQTHLLHLKNKLVEAINEDFGDYIGLSSKLAGLEGAVMRMRQPLVDIQAKLSSVEDLVQAELQALQQGLQRRQDAAASLRTLELMQEVAAGTGKVEKLLQEVSQQQQPDSSRTAASSAPPAAADSSNGNSSTNDHLDDHCRILERVAGEAARLLYLAERGKQLAFVKILERRVTGCRVNLDKQLQAALLAALRAHCWSAAVHCLRGYLELGEAGRAEQGLRAGLVGPLVRQVVAQVRQQGTAAAAAAGGGSQRDSGSNALAQVVDQTLARLQFEAGPLVSQLCVAGSGLSGIDLLGAVLLAELSEAVAEGMPGVFSPGNPVAFHQSYLAGQSLLDQLEGLAGSRAAVERLRSSTAAAGWAKRWNLAVYFSLVYQDIAGNFEAAARVSQLQFVEQQSGAPRLQLTISSSLWSSLQRALSPEVFILHLADRFTKLCSQLLVRYDTWLQDVLTHRQQAAEGAAAASAGPPASAGTIAAGSAASAAAGGEGAAAGTEAAAAVGPSAWAAALSSEACAVLCADADTIQGLVAQELSEQLTNQLCHIPADVVQHVTDMIKQLAANIAQHGQQILLLLCGDVLERCMSMVKQLKGITATYRMTAKGPPVRHSHYVAGVLQPLRQLLDTPGPVAQLPASLRLLLSREVIDSVNTRYGSLAAELLTTVKKTESSLKRLKKTRPGEAAGPDSAGVAAAAGMSDSDKICLQLFLDVQEHGRHISKFGLDPEELASYRQLLATVTPADRQTETEQ